MTYKNWATVSGVVLGLAVGLFGVAATVESGGNDAGWWWQAGTASASGGAGVALLSLAIFPALLARGRQLDGRDEDVDLTIERANYGVGGKEVSVVDILSEQVTERGLDIVVDNVSMGSDPAQGRHKHLWVAYRESGGPVREKIVYEGDRMRLP